MRAHCSRLVAAVLLPVYLGACTQWTVQPISPMQVQTISEKRPAKIRVTLADSTRLEFDDISLVGDSIVGRIAGTRGADARWQKVGINQVALLETASSNTKMLATIGVLTAAVVIISVIPPRRGEPVVIKPDGPILGSW